MGWADPPGADQRGQLAAPVEDRHSGGGHRIELPSRLRGSGFPIGLLHRARNRIADLVCSQHPHGLGRAADPSYCFSRSGQACDGLTNREEERMVTVVISPRRVVKFLDGGGHFWVYMQYVQGLHQLGCEVYWLERFHSSGDQACDALVLSTFVKRMERYGLAGKLMLYMSHEQSGDSGQYTYLGMTQL